MPGLALAASADPSEREIQLAATRPQAGLRASWRYLVRLKVCSKTILKVPLKG